MGTEEKTTHPMSPLPLSISVGGWMDGWMGWDLYVLFYFIVIYGGVGVVERELGFWGGRRLYVLNWTWSCTF